VAEPCRGEGAVARRDWLQEQLWPVPLLQVAPLETLELRQQSSSKVDEQSMKVRPVQKIPSTVAQLLSQEAGLLELFSLLVLQQELES